MSDQLAPPASKDPSFKPLVRSILLEILAYLPVAGAYLLIFLQVASSPLTNLHNNSPWLYAIASFLLIVGQGVLAEAFTSWLLRRIGLRK